MPLSILSSTHACTIPVPCPASSHCPDCTELDNISKKLALLQNRQAEIYEKVNARRDLMTSKLPIEVICHIFEDYVSLHQVNKPSKLVPLSEDIHVGFPQYFDTFHRSAPLRLGSVCRRWRQIAWSYPKLWNTLLFPVDIKAHHHGAAMVSDWLDRSKLLPLRIKAERGLEPDVYDTIFDSTLAVITVINKHSDRWLSLDFRDVDPRLTKSLGECPIPHQSILQHFAAYTEYPLPLAPDFQGTESPYHSPTHLSMARCDEDIAYSVGRLARLTHITFDKIGMIAIWNIMYDLCELEAPIMVFTAHRIFDDLAGHEEGEGNTPNLFPFLHTLSLTSNIPWCRLEPFLDQLELPALRSLHYTARDRICPPNAINSLIRRSGCTLEHLILHNALDTRQNLEQVFYLAPSIRKLTASFDDTGDSDWSWLMSRLGTNGPTDDTESNDGPIFLPLLKHIHITAPSSSCWPYLGGDCTIADFPDFPQLESIHHALDQRLSKLDTVEYVCNDDDL